MIDDVQAALKAFLLFGVWRIFFLKKSQENADISKTGSRTYLLSLHDWIILCHKGRVRVAQRTSVWEFVELIFPKFGPDLQAQSLRRRAP